MVLTRCTSNKCFGYPAIPIQSTSASGLFAACPDYDGPQDGCISCSRLEDENPCETLCLRFRTRLAAEESEWPDDDREESQVWKDGTKNSTRTQGKGE